MSAELRELYQRLRDEEEQTAPSFRQTLESRRNSARKSGLGFQRFKLAGAVVVLILIAVPLLTHLSQRTPQPEAEFTMDVLEWESPTDFLLTHSEEPLLMTVPSLEIDIPDWAQESVSESLVSEETVDDS